VGAALAAGTSTRPARTHGDDLRVETVPADGGRRRSTALVGIGVALWTVTLGVAVLICLTLAAWTTAARHDDAIRPAIAVALQAWLLAHRAPLALGSGAGGTAGSVTLAPLAVTIAFGVLLVRGGRHAVRLSGASGAAGAAGAALAVAVPYGVVAALLTRPATLGGVHPSPLGALGGAFLLALCCAAAGALAESGELRPLVTRLPVRLRAISSAAAVSMLVMIGFGAAVVVLALAAHAQRAEALTASTHGGFSGAVLTAIVSAAYLPNAAVSAAALSTGPGFAVGTHTAVSLTAVHLGAVPAVPLLAALPGGTAMPVVAWLLLAGPIGAGILAGVVVRPAVAESQPAAVDAPWWERHGIVSASWGFAVGAIAGVGLAVVGVLAGGSLGGGRMAWLGPRVLPVLFASALEIGVGCAAAIWIIGARQRRRQRDAGHAGHEGHEGDEGDEGEPARV
jgi:hypothetical protein